MGIIRLETRLCICCLVAFLFGTGSPHFRSSIAHDGKIFASSRRRLEETGSEIAACLAPAKARIAFPGSSEYEAARAQVFNQRNLYTPAAFIFPTTVAQVQNAVDCAVQLSIGICPRGGGHSYEDYSLGGRDGVLVVDMAGFTDISYNETAGTVTVGSGLRLGPLKLALWNLGKISVPCGTCPTVGVGGHALGGGWGFTSRKFGILCDNMVEADVVIANGSVVTTNEQENADLLWALKGAGANSFGIVTHFTFKVHDVSAPVTRFSYNYPKSRQAQTVKAFQIWGQSAIAEVSASLYLDPSGGNTFYGTYLGPSDHLNLVLKDFLDSMSVVPSSQTLLQIDYITAVLIDAGLPQNTDPSVLNLHNYTYPTEPFKAKSIFVKPPGFSDEGIKVYIDALQAGPATSYFIFDLFGGSASVINQISPGESAWVHRNSLFSIQMFTYWKTDPSQARNDVTFIDNLWNSVLPYASSEAYQNYIDKDMPLSAYYGSNLNKLMIEKKTWDRSNVFNFPQSIPVS